jgi:hypothetical protein
MILRLTLLERLLHRSGRLPFPIMDSFGSVLFGRAFVAAVRRGVFESFRTGPRSVAEVSLASGLAPDALMLVLESSSVGGYVRSWKGRYELTSAGRAWLLRDSPSSLVSLIGYFETLHQRWGNLDQSLERGKPEQPYYAKFGAEDWRLYVYAMRDLARFLIPYIMPRISIPEGSRSLLDIGGSHGLYTIECVRRVPALHGTVIDFPAVTLLTEELVREQQMERRISVLAGDLRKISYPSKQDVVLLFNVVHGLSPEENEHGIQRALEAMNPGGKLFILEQCLERKDRSPLARFLPLMVGLNLLLETGARAYTVEEIREWCKPARGFRRVRIPLPGLALIEAER